MNDQAKSRRTAFEALFLVIFGVAVLLSSCAEVKVPESQVQARLSITRPEWRAGDQWIYAWTAGESKGTKISQVLGSREVRGAQYLVLRIEPVNAYFTLDLHWAWATSIAESRVTSRAIPPLPWFNWPLEVGKRWEYQGVLESQESKDRVRDSYKVMGMEDVQVPAGTFRAVRIVREVNASVVDQYWYAPDVRWYVKWLGRRGKDEFQEVLQEYRPAPQASVPAPAVDRPASPGESRPRP